MHAISANCLLVTEQTALGATVWAPAGSWLGVCHKLLLVQHVGSRICHGAAVCSADGQWLTKGAVLGDHHRQHPTLLLQLEGCPVPHPSLGATKPCSSLACWVFLGKKGEGTAQELMVNGYLVLPLSRGEMWWNKCPALLKHFFIKSNGICPLAPTSCRDHVSVN